MEMKKISIKERIDDAQILYENGRKEGALLSILVAVTATSRKRYPEKPEPDSQEIRDGEAFRKFVRDEVHKLTPGWFGYSTFKVQFRGNDLSIEQLLWKFMRCELAHSGELPDDIYFEPGNCVKISVQDEKVVFSDGIIHGLVKIVVEAPENVDLFKVQ